MEITFSSSFVRFLWIGLISIFLVMMAGSIVRITDSGMGCPDWPKCFGKIIPPTSVNQLPNNYKEMFSEKRERKLDKFIRILNGVGLTSQAEKLEINKGNILIEQTFNARNTWIEYINRLFGFLCGNVILFTFIWVLLKYRKRKLVILSGINLVFLILQAWFGSIVVATSLVPWTITVHMFLAILIVALQLYLIRLCSPIHRKNILVKSWVYWLIFFTFIVTFFQLFLGTQVREDIDLMGKSGIMQANWNDNFSLVYFIHRSFSWLVLILIAGIYWYNQKHDKIRLINWTFYFLTIELILGVALGDFSVPELVRTFHLMLATFLISTLILSIYRMKITKQNTI